MSKSAKLEQEDFRLTCLEERLRELQEEDLKSYNTVREEVHPTHQVTSIQKMIDEERQHREFMAETKLKELEGIDERLAARMHQAVNVAYSHAVKSRGRGKTDPLH